MSTFQPFNVSGETQEGLGTVYVTLPGNMFNTPLGNPPNIDPVPGLLYVNGTVTYGLDQFGNVRAIVKNLDGSTPT